MSNVFKIGSIADIINSGTKDKSKKKKSNVAERFGTLIDETKGQDIEIKTPIIDKKKKRKTIPEVKNESEESGDDLDNKEVDEDEEEAQNETTPSKKSIINDSEDKLKRTIFVGNLPKNIDEKALRRLFIKFGRIQSVRLRGAVPREQTISKKVAIITKKIHEKVNSIQGYVVFKSEDSVPKALELNGTVIDGHHIRVDTVTKDANYDNSRSVFVGNLPFVLKDDQLYEFFKECGDIEAVRVVRDTETGVGKGFAFVLFKSKDSVVLALEKNETELRGREIRVKRIANTKNTTDKKRKRKASESGDRQTPKKQKFAKQKSQKMSKSPNNDSQTSKKSETDNEKPVKRSKTFETKSDFKGMAAKKSKLKKIKRKKEIKASKAKKRGNKLAQIFANRGVDKSK